VPHLAVTVLLHRRCHYLVMLVSMRRVTTAVCITRMAPERRRSVDSRRAFHRLSDCRGTRVVPKRAPFCIRTFSVESRNNLHDEDDHITGVECYQHALDALEKAKRQQEESKQQKSAEQFEAWKKAQEKSSSSTSLKEGVAVVRTIARQARRDRKKQRTNNEQDWKDDAKRWMEAAAFQHGHAKAQVRLGNDALEEANEMAL